MEQNQRFIFFKEVLNEVLLLISTYYDKCETYDNYLRLFDVIETLLDHYNSKFKFVKFGAILIDEKCSDINLELSFIFFMSNLEKKRGFKKEFEKEIDIKAIFRDIKLKNLMDML
jgi:hypothetical protein